MELNFSVTNQKIKYNSNLYIVEKSRNYLTAKFTFSGSEWKNIAKTALFKKDGKVIKMVLDANGRCEIPPEVITKGILEVSVFGGDLITVDSANVKILKSGYEEGEAPQEPPPDVYAQILAELQSIRTSFITEEQLGQAVEDWLAVNVVEALSPEDVGEIVNAYMDEHKEELQGEQGAVFTPKVTEEGMLEWSNNNELPNPQPFNFKTLCATIAGTKLGLSIDENYIMTLQLLNGTGEVLSEKQFDFPIESTVVNAKYANGTLTLILQNGNEVPINVSDIVRGLVSSSFKIAGIDMTDDITAEELIKALGVDNKVDKEDGKGLSTNDYDNTEKATVAKNKEDIATIKEDVAELQNAEDITQTTNTTLANSYAGGIKINRIAGAVMQDGTPTLELPIEIQNVEFAEIKTIGKNLFDVSKQTTRTHQGVTGTINSNQTMTMSGTATSVGAMPSWDTQPMKLKVGDILTVSTKIMGGSATIASNTVLAYMIVIVDGVEHDCKKVGSISGYSGTIDTNTEITKTQQITITEDMFSEDGYVYIGSQTYMRAGDVYNDLVLSRQIELNSDATEYEPYKESTALISFIGRAVEVDADADYTYEKDGKYYIADTIEKTDTGYQLVQRIGEGVFDGSSDENWWKSGENTAVDEFTLVLDGFKPPYSNMICSHFIYDRDSNKTGTFRNYYSDAWTYPHQVYFMFSEYGTTTIEAFKEWISSNPITIHYILAEPISTTLTDEKVIALLSLKSFDTTTHISTDSELQPVVDLEYGTSKVGGYTLDSLNTAQRNEININALFNATTENAENENDTESSVETTDV